MTRAWSVARGPSAGVRSPPPARTSTVSLPVVPGRPSIPPAFPSSAAGAPSLGSRAHRSNPILDSRSRSRSVPAGTAFSRCWAPLRAIGGQRDVSRRFFLPCVRPGRRSAAQGSLTGSTSPNSPARPSLPSRLPPLWLASTAVSPSTRGVMREEDAMRGWKLLEPLEIEAVFGFFEFIGEDTRVNRTQSAETTINPRFTMAKAFRREHLGSDRCIRHDARRAEEVMGREGVSLESPRCRARFPSLALPIHEAGGSFGCRKTDEIVEIAAGPRCARTASPLPGIRFALPCGRTETRNRSAHQGRFTRLRRGGPPADPAGNTLTGRPPRTSGIPDQGALAPSPAGLGQPSLPFCVPAPVA